MSVIQKQILEYYFFAHPSNLNTELEYFFNRSLLCQQNSPNYSTEPGWSIIFKKVTAGSMMPARISTIISMPRTMLSRLYCFTTKAIILETYQLAKNERIPQNSTSLRLYYPPIRFVKRPVKLVNTTVNVQVAEVRRFGKPIFSHFGVKIIPPPSPRRPPKKPA